MALALRRAGTSATQSGVAPAHGFAQLPASGSGPAFVGDQHRDQPMQVRFQAPSSPADPSPSSSPAAAAPAVDDSNPDDAHHAEFM